jgi:exopolysaccharide biosynthesis polyprenyl glycosylphosphotransferase
VSPSFFGGENGMTAAIEATAGTPTAAATSTRDLAVSRPREFPWRRGFPALALTGDVVSAVVVVLVADLELRSSAGSATASAPFVVALWVAIVALTGGYRYGAEETGAKLARHLMNAAVAYTGALATAVMILDGRASRPAFLTTVIAVPLLSGVLRGVLRVLAMRAWSQGRGVQRVVVAGDEAAVQRAVAQLVEDGRYRGNKVVGACMPLQGQHSDLLDAGVPVVGGMDSIERTAALTKAHAVVLVSTAQMTPLELRRLAWTLADARTELYVAPPFESVTPDRLEVVDLGSVVGLKVLRPRTHGVLVAVQDMAQRLAALVGLVVLSPLLLGLALAVRLDSSGPAFYTQTRSGRDGKPFRLYKFRTMSLDADARRDELVVLNESDGPLFKLRNDPRVTRVGRLLRRASLDELPQLINVVLGDMLLIGPRPPLPSEVAQYDHDTRRRLVVKPGLTGLWQVSGRANLSWQESVQLDLRYVDNRSLPGDVAILWRTVRAVTRGIGAY